MHIFEQVVSHKLPDSCFPEAAYQCYVASCFDSTMFSHIVAFCGSVSRSMGVFSLLLKCIDFYTNASYCAEGQCKDSNVSSTHHCLICLVRKYTEILV